MCDFFLEATFNCVCVRTEYKTKCEKNDLRGIGIVWGQIFVLCVCVCVCVFVVDEFLLVLLIKM